MLKRRCATSQCLPVTGARQVGKAIRLRHEFPEYRRVNFDGRLARLQARDEPKVFFLNHPKSLFIDEVQKEAEAGIMAEINVVEDADFLEAARHMR